MIGAFYAAGHSAARVAEIVGNIDYGALLDFRGGGGLLGHDGLEKLLREHLPETFGELEIPLVVPAVDIDKAERVVFSAGALVPALCASNAFPGVFMPVEHEGRALVDGGILSNVPLDLIRPLTAARVVAVDTRPSPTAPLKLPEADASLWRRFRGPARGGVPVIARVLEKAYTITQSRLIELTYTMHPPDLTVRPDLGDDFDIQNFGGFEEAREAGRRAARAALGDLAALDRGTA